MATAEKLLETARAELGVKESPAGSNQVKYNAWYYGRTVSGAAYPWCMAFVQWCCAQAGVELPAKTASGSALMTAAKKAGLWVTDDYHPGDIALFDWQGDKRPDHCGIVELALPSGKYATIEGNTSVSNDSNGGQVMRRTRAAAAILGAVRPKYDAPATLDNTPSPTHKAGVEWAVANGILTGGKDGDLHLSEPVTRQQMCTMLYRACAKRTDGAGK